MLCALKERFYSFAVICLPFIGWVLIPPPPPAPIQIPLLLSLINLWMAIGDKIDFCCLLQLPVSTVRTCGSGQDRRERVSMSVSPPRFPPSCHLGKHEANNKDTTNVSPIWLNCIQRVANTRELYLRVCHQGEGFRTVWFFSCLMFSPAERALSCLDLCLQEPKYPSHDIMRSGCLSFSKTEGRAKGIGGPATSERGEREPLLGTMGAWGFVIQNPEPVSTLLLWPSQIGPNNGIVGMPTPKQLCQGFCVSAWSLVSRWKKVTGGRGQSSCRLIHVRLREMGRWLCQGAVIAILRVSEFLWKTGERTAWCTQWPQQARKDIALKLSADQKYFQSSLHVSKIWGLLGSPQIILAIKELTLKLLRTKVFGRVEGSYRVITVWFSGSLTFLFSHPFLISEM